VTSGNGNKLVYGPDGRPLISQVGLVVIQVPVGVPQLPPQAVQQIASLTHSNVIVVPLGTDIMLGRIAAETLEYIHTTIHKVLELQGDKRSTTPPSN